MSEAFIPTIPSDSIITTAWSEFSLVLSEISLQNISREKVEPNVSASSYNTCLDLFIVRKKWERDEYKF